MAYLNRTTKQWQDIDTAHHLHPFTDYKSLAKEGTNVIVKADGAYLTNTDDKQFLDAMSGLWCVNVGYGRKSLAEVAYKQMQELPYYNSFFKTATAPSIELAQQLAEIAPNDLNHAFFSSSGSEANDTVVRMVRRYWDLKGQPTKKTFISREYAYHGSTMTGVSLGGNLGRGAGLMSKGTSGILGAGGKLDVFKTITAASMLPLLGIGTGEETEEEAQAILQGQGLDIDAIRANPNQYLARAFKAEGGSMDEPVAKKTMPLLDMGGQEMDLRAEGGFVPIGRMEKADDVPARLSKNEFVFTAEAVRNAGEGDVDKGAEVMYNMMKNLEAGGDVSEESQGLEGARRMFQTSQRLEEVL